MVKLSMLLQLVVFWQGSDKHLIPHTHLCL